LSKSLANPLERAKLAGKIISLLVLKKAKETINKTFAKRKNRQFERCVRILTKAAYHTTCSSHQTKDGWCCSCDKRLY
ncbi:PIPO, partial [Brugmansia suaveolens mottle virus]|uniref:PIPO n=1 Tax=Brugmansia suaveolens mottle virus TaxID=487155 RepID=UPI0002655019